MNELKVNSMKYIVKDNKLYRISDNDSKDEYIVCIGLEVHAQIKTKTKLFSRSIVDDSSSPNSNLDYLDAGLPGALPIINKFAMEQALKTSLALNMQINLISVFDRKHYFYQDSPLGYQITQFFKPIGYKGFLDFNFGRININRLHVESDAGKSIYENGKTFIDLNRIGVGLMEIVTEPDFENAQQVVEYLKELRAILIEIDTSNADMEKGNFRADVNISINKPGEPMGTRVEIKNLNSFQNIKKAIEYEFKLQKETLEKGEEVVQATKLFDVDRNETKILRTKEDFIDYGYFPEPDLLPVHFTAEQVENIKTTIPKLPSEYRVEYKISSLNEEQIQIILESKTRNNFIQNLKEILNKDMFIIAVKFFCSDILGWIVKKNLSFEEMLEEQKNFKTNFIYMLNLLADEKITKANGKQMLLKILENPEKIAHDIVEEEGYLNKNTYDIDLIIKELMQNSEAEIKKYKNGNSKIIMFFVGVVMKKTAGQAEPDMIKQKIIKILDGENKDE